MKKASQGSMLWGFLMAIESVGDSIRKDLS